MRRFALLLLTAIAAAPAGAAPCTCEPSESGAPETILTTDSAAGHQLRLRLAADPVTMAVKEGFLCTAPARSVSRVQLWMPSMGHGSSPTRLEAVTADCTFVQRLNFLMAGDWEIRVSLQDSDSAVFALDVQ